MRPHDILLRSPSELDPVTRQAGEPGPPAIVQRSDDDFIEAVLEALRSEPGRGELATTLAATRSGGVLKLFQPVQKQFHIAIVEGVCDAPGEPRIDPARVESAGMVLRRIRPGSTVRQGWMRAAGKLRGWVNIDANTDSDQRHDPLPVNRLARKAVGPPAIARELAMHAAQAPGALLAEHVIPLFLAPPDICAQAGKTLYYGLVPTTSSDLSEAPGEMPEGFGASSAAFREHLVAPLRGDAMGLPWAGYTVAPNWRDTADLPPGSSGHVPALSVFVLMLRQLAIEFDAFGDSPASRALYAELESIALPLVLRPGETAHRTVTAGAFLCACVPILLERDGSAPGREMPESWPALGAAAAARLARALSAALGERFKGLQGRAGRFDMAGASYQIRAFLRVRPECGCPARTVWSRYSERFTIAPWYEGAAASPVLVPLPDVTDRDALKQLKPNIAFVVPPKLNNLLNRDAADLAEGKGGEPPGNPDLQWICAFSIPIITICAFIVLNIFLTLFDLIFRWLLFIKICIPFPKISSSNSSGGP